MKTATAILVAFAAGLAAALPSASSSSSTLEERGARWEVVPSCVRDADCGGCDGSKQWASLLKDARADPSKPRECGRCRTVYRAVQGADYRLAEKTCIKSQLRGEYLERFLNGTIADQEAQDQRKKELAAHGVVLVG
ncbi:hypothetical protein JDV02_001631 [Purpureocillium takamizusanense]|uniref:Uncharacterized protein n=1 Tax=Purpureocillium takamizusanense TaxID=2060973 RepID=A0A9Q8Q8L5_9HYPO|nr:uncharacterized protein JDV02_001631 [Purpureocillium takamizusanense]UNI15060.1 hypothetical protein JDV02_001631 [Purpureocillium takamizusanense]